MYIEDLWRLTNMYGYLWGGEAAAILVVRPVELFGSEEKYVLDCLLRARQDLW